MELEKFKRITPAMMSAIAVIRAIETGSLKITMPFRRILSDLRCLARAKP